MLHAHAQCVYPTSSSIPASPGAAGIMPTLVAATTVASLFPELQSIDPSALTSWTSGERDSESAEQLLELASGVRSKALRQLRTVCSAAGATWATVSDGVAVESLLALLLAALTHSGVAAEAAAALISVLRCSGAGSHGVFDPFVLFELTKALRELICAEQAPAAAARVNKPAAAGKSRKRGGGRSRNAADSDDEMEDAEDGRAAGPSVGGMLLEELSLLLQRVPLHSQAEAHAELVSLLASVGPHDARAYDVLMHCLSSVHGEAEHTLPTVMRALLPTIALNGVACSLANQRSCVDFVARALDAQLATGDVRRAGAALHAVQALLHQASTTCPERAEPRTQVCKTLARLLVRLPEPATAAFASFLWKLSRTAKAGARVFAVEMAGCALQAAAASTTQQTSVHSDGTPQTLWRLLVDRITDKVPAVRSKALGVLAETLSDLGQESPTRLLLRLVQQPLPSPSSAAGDTPSSAVVDASPGPGRAATPGSVPPPPSQGAQASRRDSTGTVASLADASPAKQSPAASLLAAASNAEVSLAALGNLLFARVTDDKVAVRRTAIAAVEAWAVSSELELNASQVSVLRQRCLDTSSQIRKQAGKSIADLLQRSPQNGALRAAWVHGVLPLVRDTEASVSESALEALREAVLRPLDRCHSDPSAGFETSAWTLLEALTPEVEPLLQRAISKLASTGRLPASLAKTAISMLSLPNDTPPPPGAPPPPPQPEAAPADQPAEPPSSGRHRPGRSALWCIVNELAKGQRDGSTAEGVAPANGPGA